MLDLRHQVLRHLMHVMSSASVLRSGTKTWNGRLHLLVLLFNAWCHPSMSLLIWIYPRKHNSSLTSILVHQSRSPRHTEVRPPPHYIHSRLHTGAHTFHGYVLRAGTTGSSTSYINNLYLGVIDIYFLILHYYYFTKCIVIHCLTNNVHTSKYL